MQIPPRSAVAIITNGSKFLLGKSTASDFRKGKWTFVGGGIDYWRGEDPVGAAVREAREESNSTVIPISEPFTVGARKDIVFIVCKYIEGLIIPNSEFHLMGWFDWDKLPVECLEQTVVI